MEACDNDFTSTPNDDSCKMSLLGLTKVVSPYGKGADDTSGVSLEAPSHKASIDTQGRSFFGQRNARSDLATIGLSKVASPYQPNDRDDSDSEGDKDPGRRRYSACCVAPQSGEIDPKKPQKSDMSEKLLQEMSADVDCGLYIASPRNSYRSTSDRLSRNSFASPRNSYNNTGDRLSRNSFASPRHSFRNNGTNDRLSRNSFARNTSGRSTPDARDSFKSEMSEIEPRPSDRLTGRSSYRATGAKKLLNVRKAQSNTENEGESDPGRRRYSQCLVAPQSCDSDQKKPQQSDKSEELLQEMSADVDCGTYMATPRHSYRSNNTGDRLSRNSFASPRNSFRNSNADDRLSRNSFARNTSGRSTLDARNSFKYSFVMTEVDQRPSDRLTGRSSYGSNGGAKKFLSLRKPQRTGYVPNQHQDENDVQEGRCSFRTGDYGDTESPKHSPVVPSGIPRAPRSIRSMRQASSTTSIVEDVFLLSKRPASRHTDIITGQSMSEEEKPIADEKDITAMQSNDETTREKTVIDESALCQKEGVGTGEKLATTEKREAFSSQDAMSKVGTVESLSTVADTYARTSLTT